MNNQLVGNTSLKFKIELRYMLEINEVKYKLFSLNKSEVVSIPLVGYLNLHVHHIEHHGRTVLHQKICLPSKYLRRLLNRPHGSLKKYLHFRFHQMHIKLICWEQATQSMQDTLVYYTKHVSI